VITGPPLSDWPKRPGARRPPPAVLQSRLEVNAGHVAGTVSIAVASAEGELGIAPAEDPSREVPRPSGSMIVQAGAAGSRRHWHTFPPDREHLSAGAISWSPGSSIAYDLHV
jgi:hypothetical protein